MLAFLAGSPTPSGHAVRLGSPRMQGNLFKHVDDMNANKASALVESYRVRIENIRSK